MFPKDLLFTLFLSTRTSSNPPAPKAGASHRQGAGREAREQESNLAGRLQALGDCHLHQQTCHTQSPLTHVTQSPLTRDTQVTPHTHHSHPSSTMSHKVTPHTQCHTQSPLTHNVTHSHPSTKAREGFNSVERQGGTKKMISAWV